jgi:hypothetical protein
VLLGPLKRAVTAGGDLEKKNVLQRRKMEQ